MSELLFSQMQSYAWSLYFARWLLTEEQNHSVSKTEHQINTRIYNNSFCGLLKYGYPYSTVIQDGAEYLCLEINGVTYKCPSNTAVNILRMDFDTIAEGAVKPADSVEGEAKPKPSGIPEKPAIKNQKFQTNGEASGQMGDKKEQKSNQTEGDIPRESAVSNPKEPPPPISITLDDIIFSPPARKEVLEICDSVPETGLSETTPSEAAGAAFGSDAEVTSAESVETDVLSAEQLPEKGYGRFRPKNMPDRQNMQTQLQETGQEMSDSKPKRRPLFRGRKKDEVELTQPSKVYDEKSGGKSHPAQTVAHQADSGRLFQHIHIVSLKKQFGSDVLGPYRFIFWPVQIPEVRNGKMWADFIVHITEPNGEETVACTDGTYKELIITLDGREFNIFSTWDNGIYESHVTLRSKTASIYAISEELHREEPSEQIDDTYLNQFRYERKGQPKHFVVPFSRSSNEEENVPVIGYVEVAHKKYPLARREGNTLRYKYAGNEKIIRGWWKGGRFKYSVEDDNRF